MPPEPPTENSWPGSTHHERSMVRDRQPARRGHGAQDSYVHHSCCSRGRHRQVPYPGTRRDSALSLTAGPRRPGHTPASGYLPPQSSLDSGGPTNRSYQIR